MSLNINIKNRSLPKGMLIRRIIKKNPKLQGGFKKWLVSFEEC